MLEDGQDEVVLGREVGIKRGLGDPGLGDDPVDADGPKALLVGTTYRPSRGCVAGL